MTPTYKFKTRKAQQFAEKADKIIPYELNVPQLLTYQILTTRKKLEVMVCEWGRGCGKTAMEGIVLGHIVKVMPRSKWGIYAPSYQKFFEDEFPSIKYSLEKLGLYEDYHYYVGRRAPRSKHFEDAYQAPDDYGHCIHFWNGTTFQVLSEQKADAAVGLNLDGLIVTEAVYCNIEKLERKVFPTVRGSNVKAFEHINIFCAKLFFSTTNVDNQGRWFTDLRDIAKDNPDTWAYIQSPTTANLMNLKKGYLEEARKLAANEIIFNAEYLCIRPPVVDNAFYTLLNKQTHTYTNAVPNNTDSCIHDLDLNHNAPLIVGLDFGATIISGVIAQRTISEIRFIKDFYSLESDNEIQDDLAHKIGKYYKDHKRKAITLYYDSQGNNNTGNTYQTRAQQFAAILRQYGFIVTLGTKTMKNPYHEIKQVIWQRIMNEEDVYYPNFRINATNAAKLFASMQNTVAKRDDRGKIKKDKTSERKLAKQYRYLATDLGDAADYIILGLFFDQYKRVNRSGLAA